MTNLFFIILLILTLIFVYLHKISLILGIVIIIGIFLSWLVFIYNSLVQLLQQVNESWSDIEVQLKRRADLIPNLIETVKGYIIHEREVLERITEARTKFLAASTMKEKEDADNILTSALKSLFAVAENYPDLKANQNFLELQRELTDTEDKIQASRRFYNAVVREYNTFLESFPVNIFRKFFVKFQPKEYFELESIESEVPKVKF